MFRDLGFWGFGFWIFGMFRRKLHRASSMPDHWLGVKDPSM